MTVVYDILAQGQVGSSAGTLLTGAAGGTIVKHIKITNVHASTSYTLKVWVNGNADANIWLNTVTLAPGESMEFDGTLSLGSGDTIQAIAGAASVLNYLISGATA